MRENNQPVLGQHPNTPITTYYFTDPHEVRADTDAYCGIISPLNKKDIDQVCIYLHWTRDNLPDLLVFGPLLTTWEVCHMIEEFYGYERIFIPSDEIGDDFIEINIEANWYNYQSYPTELERVNQLRTYEVDDAPMKMLTILMNHFSSSSADKLTSKHQLEQFLKEKNIYREWGWKNGFNQPISTLNLGLDNYSYFL